MDAILDKLLDKVSKKQVICVVAMVALMQLQAQPYYIFGIASMAIAAQTYLDKGEKNENKADNADLPAGG